MKTYDCCRQRKFRSQTCDLWTDAATEVRRVSDEKESEEKELDKKTSRKKINVRGKVEKS